MGGARGRRVASSLPDFIFTGMPYKFMSFLAKWRLQSAAVLGPRMMSAQVFHIGCCRHDASSRLAKTVAVLIVNSRMHSPVTFNTVKSWTRAGSWAGSGGRDPPCEGKGHGATPSARYGGEFERDMASAATLPATVVHETAIGFTEDRAEETRPALAEAPAAASALVPS
jgi:hypothetical protein